MRLHCKTRRQTTGKRYSFKLAPLHHAIVESDQGINSRSAIVHYVPTPQIIGYWQAAACPRAARKSATYRSPRSRILAALVPSVGTMTIQIGFGSRAGAMNAQASSITHEPCVSSKVERHNDPINEIPTAS